MSWFFPQGKGREVFRGWAEGWLRWFAHPFAGVECRPDLSPTSAPSSSEVAVGWFCFGLVFFVYCPEFVPIVHACGWF